MKHFKLLKESCVKFILHTDFPIAEAKNFINEENAKSKSNFFKAAMVQASSIYKKAREHFELASELISVASKISEDKKF